VPLRAGSVPLSRRLGRRLNRSLGFRHLVVEPLPVDRRALLLIIVDWYVDWLKGRPLNGDVMELRDVGVLECLFRADALIGIELQQTVKKVECLGGSGREALPPSLLGGGLCAGEIFLSDPRREAA